MKIHPSHYEQVTALTDLVLGFLAFYALTQINQFDDLRALIWTWAFGLLVAASFIGTIAHGFDMKESTNILIWRPLNLCLGLALGLFMAGALYDWQGAEIALTAIPFLIGAGVIFFFVTVLIPNTFLTFIAYEAVAMFFALGVYGWLYIQGSLPGAGWIALGVIVTIIAAAVQALGKAGKRIVWYFDNNGVFHLIQMAGVILLLIGLKLGW